MSSIPSIWDRYYASVEEVKEGQWWVAEHVNGLRVVGLGPDHPVVQTKNAARVVWNDKVGAQVPRIETEDDILVVGQKGKKGSGSGGRKKPPTFREGDVVGQVEDKDGVSHPLVLPVSGTMIEVNTALATHPEHVHAIANKTNAWLFILGSFVDAQTKRAARADKKKRRQPNPIQPSSSTATSSSTSSNSSNSSTSKKRPRSP